MQNSKIFGSNFWSFLAALCAWKLVIDYGYVIFIHPLYSYAGFNLFDNSFRVLEGYITILILGLLCSIGNPRRPSSYLLLILFLTAIVPASTMFALGGKERWMFYCIVGIFIVTFITSKVKINLTLSTPKYGTRFVVGLCLALIGTFLLNVLTSTGLTYFNLDFDNVYDVRSVTKDLHYGALFGYINGWATKVAPLVLLTFAIVSKRSMYIVGCILLIVLLYGFSSHKTVLFAPFCC